MPGKKKKGNEPKKVVKTIQIPVRDNVPLSIFYPEEKRRMKQDTNYFDTLLTYADKKQIIQQFPSVQNKEADLFFAEKSYLKINNGKKIQGAVALTLHFVGIFRFNPDFTFTKIKCVHIYDIYSIRIKQSNKTLLYCRIENASGQNSEVFNVHINSPYAIEFTQTLYRNYLLSTVAYDSYETCDFRSYDPSLFPPFDNGLSPSQGYQLTYFCFCSRLKMPYNHEFTRFYHEHICNFDGFFDFSLIFDSTNLKPALYAMMFVPFVMAIICHKVKIENISQSIELIIKRSNYLRALHLSGCDIDQDGIKRMGDALVENLDIYTKRITSKNPKYDGYQEKFPVPIPVQYWNFENNNLVDATSFFKGLKNPAFTADIFYLSFSNCHIQDITLLFDAIRSNEHLHQIKYLYFNGNQKVGTDEMEVFIKHLNYLADFVSQPEKKKNRVRKCLYESIGVSGKGKALEKLFQTLIDREYPIRELSLAGSTIDRKPKTQFYTPSRSAAAIINYFNHANELELIDLSSIDCDKQDLSLILKGMNRSQMLNRIHVKLNHIKKSEKDYEPLLAVAKAFLYTNMEKWESLEFADNYLNGFELDFLLSIFLKMPNLKMLNLSNNFHKDDKSISQVLFKLSQLNLTKLYLAGSFDSQRYLQTQTFDLLTKLTEQGLLEELDISGNLMGDKCYEYVVEIINSCPNLHTLIIDQNKPKNFQLFDDVIHLIMRKRNLIFFPFPSRDLMHIFHHCSGIKELDDEELSQFRWYLINLRYDCINKINSHRKKVGLPPQLPFNAVPELGEMVNEVHAEMKRLLQNIRFYIHGGVAIDIKVPLPYLHDNQEFSNGRNITDYVPNDYDPNEIIAKYHAKNIFKRIDESQVNKLYDVDIIAIRKKLDDTTIIQPRYNTNNNNNKEEEEENDEDGQNGNQNGRQNGNQNGRQNGNQNGRQNGNQNGRQNGNQNGRQNGNQNGRQNGNQNGRQNGNQNGARGRGSNANGRGHRNGIENKNKKKNRNHKRDSSNTEEGDSEEESHEEDYEEDENQEEEYNDEEENQEEEYNDEEENQEEEYNDDDENDEDYNEEDDEDYNEEDAEGEIQYYKRGKYPDSKSRYHGTTPKPNRNRNHSKYKNQQSPGSPEPPRHNFPKSPKRIPTDDDDDDYEEESEQEYQESDSDPDDPAHGVRYKKTNKSNIKEYDESGDNSRKVRRFAGTKKDDQTSSTDVGSPPPYYNKYHRLKK